MINIPGTGKGALDPPDPRGAEPNSRMLMVTSSPPSPVGRGAYFLGSELVLHEGSKKLFKMSAAGLFKRGVSNLSLNLLE